MPRFVFLFLSLIFIPHANASPSDLSDAASVPDTGTFTVKEKKQRQEEQLIMEKEMAVEKEEYDAFGENKFNHNDDPDIYNEEGPKPQVKKGER